MINEGGKSVLNDKVCVATHSSDLAPRALTLRNAAARVHCGPAARSWQGRARWF
jgi:hypothetical protein